MIRMTNDTGATLSLPLTMGWQKVSLSKTVSVQGLVTGGGVVSGYCDGYAPRDFTLSGSLFYGSKASNLAGYDELKRFLSHSPIEVERNDRFVVAYVTGFDCNGLDDDDELELSVSFVAPDPFFYGDEVTEEALAVTTSATVSIEVEGTSPTEPIITIEVVSATAENISISTENYVIDLAGDYEVGDVITIDCKRFLADLNGASIVGFLGDDFLIDGFVLLVGNNDVTIEADGTIDVLLKYRTKWL
jgi:phage-related protein